MHPPIRTSFLVLLLAALLAYVSGCPRPEEPITEDRPLMPRDLQANGEDKNGKYVLLVRVRLATVEVPVGQVSSSEDIWSYLDEEPIRSLRSAALGRNGIRIGVGPKDTWQEVAKILEKMAGKPVKQATLGSLPGESLPVVLKTDQPIQTIFISYDDRTLSGADYPAGENLLALSFGIDSDDPSRVIITGVPQVRTAKRYTKYIRTPSGYQAVTKPVLLSFDPLTFQLSVPRDDFLLIGPNAASRRENSLGHHFLVKQRDGVAFETVIVLFPEVFAAPLKDQEAASEQPGM